MRHVRLTVATVDRGDCGTSLASCLAAMVAFCCALLFAKLLFAAGSVKQSGATPAANVGYPQFNRGNWPFQPLARPAVPKVVELASWARNPIDDFVGQKLEAAKLKANP